MKNFKTVFLICAILCAISLTASAATVTHIEDYEYGTPGWRTFVNDIFEHTIVKDPSRTFDIWSILDTERPGNGNGIFMVFATDEITFQLAPGEYISHVSVDAADLGHASIEIIGTEGTYSPSLVDNPSGWGTYDTTGQSLGQITKLRLYAQEGMFDNIVVTVVPEPAMISLLGLGSIAVFRKRKRQ